MGDHYGDESQSASDQEDLVGASDIDDEITDMEEMQFSFCKVTDNLIENDNQDEQGNSSNENENRNINNNECHPIKTKITYYGFIVSLFLSAFSLLIIFPLYLQQLSIGNETNNDIPNNIYGAIMFTSFIIAIVYFNLAAVTSAFVKWDVKFYKLPIPWNRLLTISLCSGSAGTLCIVSSFQRVPCHLQDPLKGAALIYSLIFYFFFAKKVMGLQKLFSAATAVVGLFISIDYGLCDEYRCRGKDVTSSVHAHTAGWQGQAIWTLIYVFGIALWTLHLTLLEGHAVTFPSASQKIPANKLLATVSRIVSSTDNTIKSSVDSTTIKRKKPRVLHVIFWIQLLQFLIMISLGWIDILPATIGKVDSVGEFWRRTSSTFLCHCNLQHEVPEKRTHEKTLEFLSNLTPGSFLYNRTIQKLRRDKRSIGNSNGDDCHIPPDTDILKKISGTTTPSSSSTTNHHDLNLHKRINTEKYWRKLKNIIRYSREREKIDTTTSSSITNGASHTNITNQTPVKISRLVLYDSSRADCPNLRFYSICFICSYIVFIFFLIHFLFLSESAVLTIGIVTAALPIGGIFWSLFQLTTVGNSAVILWSPSITGELICSLLGTPIVLIGLTILCKSYLNETASISLPSKNLYTTLMSRRV